LLSSLLPKNKPNPQLDDDTQWDDLPRTSYENLARVHIQPPQSVNRDGVILSDKTKINLSELFAEREIDIDLANLILESPDNMKTIALTAKLKNQAQQLRQWLDAVEEILSQSLNRDGTHRSQDRQQSNVSVDTTDMIFEDESSSEGPNALQP
jgi:hypothetical protein